MRAKNTRDKYRKNPKNNKFNKILDLEKRRNQQGVQNVCKYHKNRKSNKDFSCELKTPVTNIAKITNLKGEEGGERWISVRVSFQTPIVRSLFALSRYI